MICGVDSHDGKWINGAFGGEQAGKRFADVPVSYKERFSIHEGSNRPWGLILPLTGHSMFVRLKGLDV